MRILNNRPHFAFCVVGGLMVASFCVACGKGRVEWNAVDAAMETASDVNKDSKDAVSDLVDATVFKTDLGNSDGDIGSDVEKDSLDVFNDSEVETSVDVVADFSVDVSVNDTTVVPPPCKSQVVYLNFAGATIVGADYPSSNSKNNVSWLVPNGSSITFPAFQSPQDISAIVSRLEWVYARWRVTFVTMPPTTGDYTMIVIGGKNTGTAVEGWAWGVAPYDEKNQNPNDIGLIFPEQSDFQSKMTTNLMARVIGHELGHSFGMAHIDSKQSIMEPLCVCADAFIAGVTVGSGFGWQEGVWVDQSALLDQTLGVTTDPCL